MVSTNHEDEGTSVVHRGSLLPYRQAAHASNCLVVLQSPSMPAGRIFALEREKAELIIGRERGADVQLPGDEISRRHFKIIWGEQEDLIEDLGSKNGTLLNGATLTRASLRHGDQLQLGRSTTLRFVPREPEELRRSRELETAEHSVRSRDELLSIASHELKTPLSSLCLQLQLLRRRSLQAGTLRPDQLDARLDAMVRQAGQLASLVQELFDLSSMRLGKQSLQRVTIDLGELAHEVFTRFEDDFANAGCEASFLSSGPALGAWDRSRLERVIGNLLGNARKYGAGRPICVRVEATAGVVRLRVSDRGIGIAKEDQRRIFERFTRAPEAERFEGLGLGLSLCREIVEAHGGKIEVESQPNKGSCFTVELPCDEPLPEAALRQPRRPPQRITPGDARLSAVS